MFLNSYKSLILVNFVFCEIFIFKNRSRINLKRFLGIGYTSMYPIFLSHIKVLLSKTRGPCIISFMEKSIGMQDIVSPPCPIRTFESEHSWDCLRECLHARCNTLLTLQLLLLPAGMKQPAVHSVKLCDCLYSREDALHSAPKDLLPIFSLFPNIIVKKGGDNLCLICSS